MDDGGLDDGWGMVDWSGNRIMTFKTKPQYLLAVPKAKNWDLPLVFKRVYKIDYDIIIKQMKTYPLIESLDRSIKPVTIVTLYGCWENPSYRWYRPNIDAIIEEGNIALLHQLFIQDVARHI
jgi:hypothetical protein